MPTVLTAVSLDSCSALRPKWLSAVCGVITSIGIWFSKAEATPVIRLVAPGPVVEQHTPSLPVLRA